MLTFNGKTIWSTGPTSSAVVLAMLSDGNLQLTNGSNDSGGWVAGPWSSGTSGNPGAYVEVSTGKARILTADGSTVLATYPATQ